MKPKVRVAARKGSDYYGRVTDLGPRRFRAYPARSYDGIFYPTRAAVRAVVKAWRKGEV